jgi:hypothetical protein
MLNLVITTLLVTWSFAFGTGFGEQCYFATIPIQGVMGSKHCLSDATSDTPTGRL